MSTPEGVFPKIGNDPIYYSELNKFNQNLLLGSVQTTTGSWTNPTYAIDGDMTTETLVTVTTSATMKFDLGKLFTLNSLGVNHYFGNITGSPNVIVQISTNDSSYTTVSDFTISIGEINLIKAFTTLVSTRYIKITITQTGGSSDYHLREIIAS